MVFSLNFVYKSDIQTSGAIKLLQYSQLTQLLFIIVTDKTYKLTLWIKVSLSQ